MKVTVWTTRNIESNTSTQKCIFKGDTDFNLAEGDLLVVRDGFCAERVAGVLYDITDDSVEITLTTQDYENEYGDCLMYGVLK